MKILFILITMIVLVGCFSSSPQEKMKTFEDEMMDSITYRKDVAGNCFAVSKQNTYGYKIMLMTYVPTDKCHEVKL